VERSEESVRLAREFVASQRLGNVEVLQGDAKATGLPRASFDLAHARLVLVNVPGPEEVVAEMIALVRPGGMVAVHDADYVTHLCEPPLPAWTDLFHLLDTYSREHGIDLFVGRRVPGMLRAAGVVDVQVRPIIHVYPHGHSRRTILLDFVANLRDRLLAGGFVAEADLSRKVESVRHHLDDPATLVTSHLFFQAWGRKPRP
jgi:SAM-dependent methyltransferase